MALHGSATGVASPNERSKRKIARTRSHNPELGYGALNKSLTKIHKQNYWGERSETSTRSWTATFLYIYIFIYLFIWCRGHPGYQDPSRRRGCSASAACNAEGVAQCCMCMRCRPLPDTYFVQ